MAPPGNESVRGKSHLGRQWWEQDLRGLDIHFLLTGIKSQEFCQLHALHHFNPHRGRNRAQVSWCLSLTLQQFLPTLPQKLCSVQAVFTGFLSNPCPPTSRWAELTGTGSAAPAPKPGLMWAVAGVCLCAWGRRWQAGTALHNHPQQWFLWDAGVGRDGIWSLCQCQLCPCSGE